MEEYFGGAEEAGLTGEEIGAVQAIVMAVSAGKAGAQFREVRLRSRRKKKRTGGS